ncbi:MAG: CPBP family intramembrane metalloprotease [Kofleriaceae bacterium]|nr:CPBP family intramembrane metalloprotease [Kofleriaceae bacterium]
MSGQAASPAPGDEGPRRRAGRTALAAWAIVAALVAGLVHVNVTLPAIGHLGSALVALLFLYVPMWIGRSRGEDLVDYGLVAAPVGRGLIIATVAWFVIFPLFVVGYFAFYEVACKTDLLAQLVPPGMCRRYGGLDALHAPALTWKLAEFCAVQLVVVALPEELFFRGFLLRLLEQRWPPRRRVLGGGVGLALVVSAAAFALIHLPKDGDPRALATFFPGLLFGWMRSATGSILASTLTHAGSNILVRLLDLSAMR